MDGVYQTNVNTPMGNIEAKVALQQSGNIINGMLEIMGSKTPLSPGKVNGNKCYFSGEFRKGLMNIKYNVTGELIDTVLHIYAKTNMGEFKLQANKIA